MYDVHVRMYVCHFLCAVLLCNSLQLAYDSAVNANCDITLVSRLPIADTCCNEDDLIDATLVAVITVCACYFVSCTVIMLSAKNTSVKLDTRLSLQYHIKAS